MVRLKIARSYWKCAFSLLGVWNSVLVIDRKRRVGNFRMDLSLSHMEIKVKLSNLDSFSLYYHTTRKITDKYFFMDA